jgi:hypothetical protein
MEAEEAQARGLPVEVLEMIAARLEATPRQVLRHASPKCRAAVRTVCAAEGAPAGNSPLKDSCALSASWLVRSLDLVLWARAQGCPWTLKQWLEKSAGAGPSLIYSAKPSLLFLLHFIHLFRGMHAYG